MRGINKFHKRSLLAHSHQEGLALLKNPTIIFLVKRIWDKMRKKGLTCMEADLRLQVPISSIHMVLQQYLMPKHQPMVASLQKANISCMPIRRIREHKVPSTSSCMEEIGPKNTLTIISANAHKISLPYKSHNMSVSWPRARSLNNHPSQNFYVSQNNYLSN